MQYWEWILVGLALAFVVVRALTTRFVCPDCGTDIRLNFFEYLFRPHMLGKRMVKCPECGRSKFLAPAREKSRT